MQPKRGARGWQGRGTLGRRARTATRALTVLHGHGGPPDGKALRTLYDLLGASPNDDAERLRSAFRAAVKANHPDVHPHDSAGATLRLSGIVRAYAILRDAHERASYDHALRAEAALLCIQPKQTFVRRMGRLLTEGVAIAAMAVVLGGGYALFANVLGQISNDRKAAELAGSQDHAAVEPHAAARTNSEREAPRDALAEVASPSIVIAPSAPAPAMKSSDAVKIAGLVPSLPEREIAKLAGDAGAATDQLDVTADQPKEDPGRPDQVQHPKAGPSVPTPPRVELSALENNNNISKAPAPEIAIPDQKPKPLRRSTDAKPAEVTPHEKPRPAAMRPPASHPPVKQASLENKSAPPCSQSCPSSNPPPLLGVGF